MMDIVHCKIIAVLTTPSVKDGFSHIPLGLLNYFSQPVFS